MTDHITDHVVEIVRFRLKENVTRDEFAATLPASNRFLEAREGFVSRRLSADEEGTWVEHIEWTSMEAAKAAAAAFFVEDSLEPMRNAIEGKGAEVNHNRIVVALEGKR